MNSDNHSLSATYQEITSQPEAWAEAIANVQAHQSTLFTLWEAEQYSRVIFTGCGSTYYLSLSAAALFQALNGTNCQAIPGGELWLNPRTAYVQGEKVLLVAISRSGSTTETIQAVRQFQKDTPGKVLVITNYPDSPLVSLGDLAIIISKGQERSVAQTRSFASMYVAATAFSALLSGRTDFLETMPDLPRLGDRLIQNYANLARTIGENLTLDRFYFLGSGTRYGLACEINLKMKEMTLTTSEAFHFLEFRHGPMSMVTESTMVVGFLSEANCEHEMAVLEEMKALGGNIMSVGNSNTDVVFKSELPESIHNVLYLPVLQLMAYYRAIVKGLDPDNPRNLSAVVHLAAEKVAPQQPIEDLV